MLPLPPADASAPRPAGAAWAELLRPLHRLRAISGKVALAALGLAVLAVGLWPSAVALVLAAVVGTLWIAVGLAWVLPRLALAGSATDRAALERLLGADPDTLVLTDRRGHALPDPAGPSETEGVEALLAPWCAEPRQAVQALLAEVGRQGRAQREFRLPAAGLRVSVHELTGLPGSRIDSEAALLWRLARIELPDRRGLEALGLPVLTLGGDAQPLAANPALLRLLDPVASPGDSAGVGAVLAPLLTQIRPGLERGERRLELRLPGGQMVGALVVPARDGQRDVVLLPGAATAEAGAGAQIGTQAGAQDFEDIPVALIQIDEEGRIFGTNRAARSLMGLAAAEDRFLWEVVEGLGRPVADWLQDARAGRALNRPEVLRAICAGPEAFVQIILRRATGGGRPGGLVAVVSDATELKSLEARFVQSQKMQAIGQLAGGIAHDFNNLLTAISGHCDLLLLGRDPYDPDFGDLMQIHQNANRAAALVRQLLAFSRKQTLQPEVLTLEALLEEVVHLLTRLVGERIVLKLRHDPSVPPIRADRRQLEQVIVNLVVNARDAMPMGGEIRIETEQVRLDADRSFGRVRVPAGDYARIRVIDTGVGIPADLVEKIFEPFFTTKRPGEGTGLGLSTAYGIVKQMGGYIFVDSVEGSGTTFSLYFAAEPLRAQDAQAPMAAGAIPPPPEGAAPAATRPDPRRDEAARRARVLPPAPEAAGIVLLVEDEAPVRAFAARALRLQGYQVLEAEDGEQALEVLADPGLTVDIFVTDVIMPGLDGPTWVAEALRARPGTPVVFVSGYIEDTLTEALGRTPGSVFLEKPFSLEALSRTIAGRVERETL